MELEEEEEELEGGRKMGATTGCMHGRRRRHPRRVQKQILWKLMTPQLFTKMERCSFAEGVEGGNAERRVRSRGEV